MPSGPVVPILEAIRLWSPGLSKDNKVDQILLHAARLFSQQSYAATSIRDIAGAAQISLAGLYYYFASKEEVLFTIQKTTFANVIESYKKKTADQTDPTQKLQTLIHNHVTYFIHNMDTMKVLSHESETLKNSYYDQIATMKREYFKILVTLIEQIAGPDRATEPHFNARTQAMNLFGMMNWIYNWYNPKHDPPADELANQMAHLFIGGVVTPPQT